ncbi:MAG: glycosyltransferase family 39 protein [Anaerolineae bacterium]
MHLKQRPSQRLVFGLVMVVYVVLGSLYAVKTPLWQVPDEPAHYNYIRYIAENGALPVLVQGDFPAEWLSVLKMFKFEGMSIDRVKYESHQPPLYYLVATPVYLLASSLKLQIPLILRFFSLLIGAFALWFGYRIVRIIFPEEPALALGTGAFLATLPMHLTMAMGINNDVLVELILALVVGLIVLSKITSWSWKRALLLGVLLGLALLTKLQAYVAVLIVLAALVWDVITTPNKRPGSFWRNTLGLAGIIFGTAFIIVLPWLIRNAQLYGLNDLLAQRRQAQVAAGQLATSTYIHQIGLKAYLVAFAQTTFQSFWGQFGWMGVVLHPRFYYAAGFLSGLSLVGFIVLFIRKLKTRPNLDTLLFRGLFILLVWGISTLLGYLWYNTQFVQFQGRYLFPAIVPLGLAFTLGFRELFRGKQYVALGAVGAVVLVLLGDGVINKNLKAFSTVMTAAAAPLLVVGKVLEKYMAGITLAVVYLAISAFSLYCLFYYIVPELSL